MDLELVPLESEVRNNQPADFEQKSRETRYLGQEHRHDTRRLCRDRRTMLRFEPAKIDRRLDINRRGGAKWNNLYSL